MRRVNLYPNPHFDPDGATTGAWGTDYAGDMPGDGTLHPSSSQGFDEFKIPELEPGAEYVFSVRSENGAGSVAIWSRENLRPSTRPDGDGLIYIRFRAPESGSQSTNRVVFANSGVYSKPQLELAETYDSAGGGFASSAGISCPSPSRACRAGDARW